MWDEPQEVQLPPRARIPHLRKAVYQQTISRLEHRIRQSRQVIASAEKARADAKRPFDKSQPSEASLVRAVDAAKIKLEIHRAELVSFRSTWAADAFKLLTPRPTDDETAAKSHKLRHDELAIIAHTAQQRLALSKAREACFQANIELNDARVAVDGKGKEGDELRRALDAAHKKAEAATQQLEVAERALTEPPVPKYQGLPGSYGSSSGRRLALGRWLANDQNPLTARVAVNHIWLRHFGRALVETVFDFGLSGKPPSHPDLLDWLAAELKEPSLVMELQQEGVRWVAGQPTAKPWSMKHLHRLIVSSRSYRSSSTPDARNLVTDPDNQWYWRLPAKRMDAEVVRDSVLAATGQLDKTLGGPDLPCSDGMSVPRRSLYFHQSPEAQLPFLKLFDSADPTECYQRHVSIVPHQALALANSQLVIVQSRVLARRMSQRFTDSDGFIAAAFEQVLSRSANLSERRLCRTFLAMREDQYRSKGKAKTEAETVDDLAQPSVDPRLHARENLVHSLFNHHDFVTIK